MESQQEAVRIVRTSGHHWLVAWVPLLTLGGGCVHHSVEGLFKHTGHHPGTPARVVTTWESRVRYAPDPAHRGKPNAGLAGRMYLFGKDLGHPMTGDGAVSVELFNTTDLPPGKVPDKPQEIWRVDPESLKKLAHRDMIGWCYNFFLPWGTYSPDTTRVMLRLSFLPKCSQVPLFADDVHLNLCSGTGKVTTTHKTNPVKPNSPPQGPQVPRAHRRPGQVQAPISPPTPGPQHARTRTPNPGRQSDPIPLPTPSSVPRPQQAPTRRTGAPPRITPMKRPGTTTTVPQEAPRMQAPPLPRRKPLPQPATAQPHSLGIQQNQPRWGASSNAAQQRLAPQLPPQRLPSTLQGGNSPPTPRPTLPGGHQTPQTTSQSGANASLPPGYRFTPKPGFTQPPRGQAIVIGQ